MQDPCGKPEQGPARENCPALGVRSTSWLKAHLNYNFIIQMHSRCRQPKSDVVHSNQPQQQVTYMTSYKLMGVAELKVDSNHTCGDETTNTAMRVYLQYRTDRHIQMRMQVFTATVLVHPLAPQQHPPQYVDSLQGHAAKSFVDTK